MACHAPATTYMVVDPRHDHSFRIPRPDLTVKLGVPNACTRCHDDQDRHSLLALTAFQCDTGNLDAGRSLARRLAALEPDDPAVRELLRQVGVTTP